MWPCSSRNWAVWKPWGSFCRMVCSITCGPANPARVPSSATMMSPRLANDAATPPYTGSVSTLKNGTRASRRRYSDAAVLAICSSESTPSCILAPPEADTTISGIDEASACSAARVTFSPTTDPMLPPRKWKSSTAMDTGCPPSRAVPVITASARPLADRARVILVG